MVIKGRAESPAGHTSTGYNSTSPRTDCNLHRIFANPMCVCILSVSSFMVKVIEEQDFGVTSMESLFYLSFEPGARSSFDAPGYGDLLHSLIMIMIMVI